MGRKKLENKEEVKKTKTPKKAEKKAPAKQKVETRKIDLSAEEIKTLQEIEKKLLKKCKKDGFINQSEIYDALNNYELDDDAVDELIAFFASSDIEVRVGDPDEEEEEEKEVEFDENNMEFNEDDEPDDDFFSSDDEDVEAEDIDVEHLDMTITGDVKVNDSVKMYLKEIGKYDLLKPSEEPIIKT